MSVEGPHPIPEKQLDEILDGRRILKELDQSQAPIATFAREHGISRTKIYRLKERGFYRKNSGIGKKQVVKEKDGNREDCPRDVALGRAMGSSELRI